VFLALVVATSVHAQEIATKDLLRPPGVDSAPIPPEEHPKNPNGCSKMSTGFADGVTLQKDKEQREIRVELVRISTKKLAISSEIIATAKLQNEGKNPIHIPWSTDFQTTLSGQNPDDRFWEFGEFRMSIRTDQNTYYTRLVTTSQGLYSSELVPDSSLTLKPGEWITARISFRIKVQNPEFETLKAGKAGLGMEWFQTGRTRRVRDCGVTFGYFPYDDMAAPPNRRVVANVTVAAPQVPAKSAQ